MSVNWENAVRSPLLRCVLVERMSISHQTHRETVAEHQWLCCYFAWLLYHSQPFYCVSRGISLSDLLERALFHDVEEVFTGDIPKPVKMKLGKTTLASLQGVQAGALRKMTAGMGEVSERLMHLWLHAKSGAVGSVVALADYMGLACMISRELQLGNTLVHLDPESVDIYIETLLDDPIVRQFRGALDAANRLLLESITVDSPPWDELKRVLQKYLEEEDGGGTS